ncbi:hypothetical protein Bca52824_046279 [Brassica carinata]|uniref:Uncharacterized protein n=1 Tax=Brassica carinata TaxID=52824 RepID=A0A8X7RGX5_BRACI|nr:hypothetical protein Bca52824_046279 [Brassica carinata]
MEPPATAEKRSSRRLLFDRRYGWVVDEWKDPSEEALAGGRGILTRPSKASEMAKSYAQPKL